MYNKYKIPLKITLEKKTVLQKLEVYNEEKKLNLNYINPNSKILTAKIIKITHKGEVLVRFNETLNLTDGIDYFKN